jgi:hypothetical protein
VRPLSPFPFEQRGSRSVLRLGDLVAEQRLEVVLRVKFGYGPVGQEVGLLVAVNDREGVMNLAGASPAGVGWEYADDRTNDAQPRDRAVDRAVAKLFAARARQDAVKLNRLGEFGEARAELREVAARILAYAGSDAELRNLASELQSEEQRFAAPMPEMARKAAFASANYSLRSRAPHGGANR